MIQENEQEARERDIAEREEEIGFVTYYLEETEHAVWRRLRERLTALLEEKRRGLEDMTQGHATKPVMVWVDVDVDIASEVEFLNSLSGVRTFASCQGTIGEAGPAPYRAQIMAWWPPEHEEEIVRRFEIGRRGDGWAYLHPYATRRESEAKETQA